jgi:hypothetical protein
MAETASESTSRRWSLKYMDSAAAIYGTIIATAVIGAGAGYTPLNKVLALTVATLVIFWLAHVYTQTLAHHLRGGTRLRWATVKEAMAEEGPMLFAPALSVVFLLLGVLGLLEDHTATRLAIWAGVAQLAGWGIVYARRQGWGWRTAAVAGAINGAFGLVIVVLEVLLH